MGSIPTRGKTLLFLHIFICSLFSAPRQKLGFQFRHSTRNALKNSAESGQRSVLILGSLCFPVVYGIQREADNGLCLKMRRWQIDEGIKWCQSLFRLKNYIKKYIYSIKWSWALERCRVDLYEIVFTHGDKITTFLCRVGKNILCYFKAIFVNEWYLLVLHIWHSFFVPRLGE